MALDMNQAIAQYDTLGALANSIPELRAKLEQGAREEWTPDRFFAEIQQTGWWKSSSEQRRQVATLKATDPATWNQTFENTKVQVRQWAAELGVEVDDAWADAYANHYLLIGLNEQQMRNFIGAKGAGGSRQDGALLGHAADMDRQIRSTFSNMGLAVTADSSRAMVNEILAGRQTLGTYENLAMRQAKTKYTHLSEQIDQGLTVKDIASPYIAQMAQALELDENAIDLSDSHIQRALMDRDDKGQARTQPLWAFERTLKDDPRWDRTKNAANQTYDLLARVGQDWGFSA